MLRFTPWAWAKLVFLRDLGPTEVGGFGISPADDLLLIEDIRLVRQRCSSVTVQFDDVAVADFFDEMVDRGLPPERFARVWIHTHPGDSASPSCVDEETFIRSFGRSDLALMFILAQGGQTTARLELAKEVNQARSGNHCDGRLHHGECSRFRPVCDVSPRGRSPVPAGQC